MGKLSELVSEITPKQRADFTMRLKPADRQELLGIRRKLLDGEYESHVTPASLSKQLSVALGVSACTLARWFREDATDGQANETSGGHSKPQGKQRSERKGKAPRKSR